MPEDKVAKKVTFNEEKNTETNSETIRNFYMMETAKEEGKLNFMMGGEEDFDDVEEKDKFPASSSNGGMLTKQLSDAALIDKRRRLRWVLNYTKLLFTGK